MLGYGLHYLSVQQPERYCSIPRRVEDFLRLEFLDRPVDSSGLKTKLLKVFGSVPTGSPKKIVHMVVEPVSIEIDGRVECT
jgi:hypothetical protein